VRRVDGRLTINLQLYDPHDDRSLWSSEAQGQSLDELLLLADSFRGLIGKEALDASPRPTTRTRCTVA
jgi:TolB-like protein